MYYLFGLVALSIICVLLRGGGVGMSSCYITQMVSFKWKCAAGDFYRFIQAACFPVWASVLNHFWGYVHSDYFIWGLNVLCTFVLRTKNWSHDRDVKLNLTIPFLQEAWAINKKNHLWIQNLCSQDYWSVLGSHTMLKSLVRNDP